jgi:hypothetical protein
MAAIFDKEVPVVVTKASLPGLYIRILSDREEGSLIWEVTYLGANGSETKKEVRKLGPAELLQWPDVLEVVQRAIMALAPRRRLDLATLLQPMEMAKITSAKERKG